MKTKSNSFRLRVVMVCIFSLPPLLLTSSCKQTPESVKLGSGVSMEMVLIPKGEFLMGSRLDPDIKQSSTLVEMEEQSHESETPQHLVKISKSFYMCKYEVSQEQWHAIMGKNPSEISGKNLPVTNVSWYDCREFVMAINRLTGKTFRLPSEAEWEYACRAGTQTRYSFGDSRTAELLNYNSKGGVKVGSYKANSFGLYDMHGNVSEWCSDWEAPYQSKDSVDPTGPPEGQFKIFRGGSWYQFQSDCRSAQRQGRGPENFRADFLGLRLVCDE